MSLISNSLIATRLLGIVNYNNKKNKIRYFSGSNLEKKIQIKKNTLEFREKEITTLRTNQY